MAKAKSARPKTVAASLPRPVADLKPDPANRRVHNPRNIQMVTDALRSVGAARSIVIDEDDVVLAGNGVVQGAAAAGITSVRVIDVEGDELIAVRRRGLTDDQKRQLALYDNRAAELAEWNATQLFVDREAGLALQPFFTDGELSAIFRADGAGLSPEAARTTLAARFGVPPFSVLDARQGYWQKRKAAWLALGIQSEVGRGENLLKFSDQVSLDRGGYAGNGKGRKRKGDARTFGQDLMRGEHVVGESRQTASLKGGLTHGTTIHPYDGTEGGDASATGTSIFDPVLCELAYRWFCPPGGRVLDPFAGGSVRGLVAALLGRTYVGIDLRAEQLAANQEQAARILDSPQRRAVAWVCGDSAEVLATHPEMGDADFLFTCPPYADLESYSDDPRDLSTMEYAEFRAAYARILAGACARLRDDRFACIVVGDVRDKSGLYRNFPAHTIEAVEAAGLRLYNDAILVTSVGSLPLRVGRQFESARKLGKTHQNVLVFVKGDPRKATEAIGTVEVGEIQAAQQAEASAVRFGEPL